MENRTPFSIKVEKIKSQKGYLDKSEVCIFQENENGEIKQIGSYIRHYPSFSETTFAPFKKENKWYALYSENYTCINIMSLPDCNKIGGEKEDSFGFCPVEIYIPTYQLETTLPKKEEELIKYPESNHWWLKKTRIERFYNEMFFKQNKEIFYSDYAFVAGCIWGDDSSWKIQLRDISKANQGVISDIDIGYHPLADLSLNKAIYIREQSWFEGDTPPSGIYFSASITQDFEIKDNKLVTN